MKNEKYYQVLFLFYGFCLSVISLCLMWESIKINSMTFMRLFFLLVMLTVGITMIKVEISRK